MHVSRYHLILVMMLCSAMYTVGDHLSRACREGRTDLRCFGRAWQDMHACIGHDNITQNRRESVIVRVHE